jgi:hypothetical protein
MNISANYITTKTLDHFELVMSPSDVQRLVGILGETCGDDADGLYEPLKDALDKVALPAIEPKRTSFGFVAEK